jgi:Transglutaminase-like superfamily
VPVILRKARNFMGRTGFEKAAFPIAWLILGASRLAIRAVPFRHLASWLGMQASASPCVPLLGSRSEARAAVVGRVVRLAARYTPWESNCLPQALTARIVLGLYRIPYSLFLGVARDSGETSIQAHAWLTAGRVSVTGGESFGQFTVVGCFLARELATVITVAPFNPANRSTATRHP